MEDAGRSGAARVVPYASRLVLEAWGRRTSSSSSSGSSSSGGSSSSSSSGSSSGVERIRLAYNGRVLATLQGGLPEWRARYAAALAVRWVGGAGGGASGGGGHGWALIRSGG